MMPDVLGPLSGHILVFCRIGACIMLMPGYSSFHIPQQVRLFLALAVSISITPLVVTVPVEAGQTAGTHWALTAIAAELTVGVLMGSIGRVLFASVQFAGGIIAPSTGFGGQGMVDDGSGEFEPEIGALVSAGMLILMLALDFHTNVIRAAVVSYDVLPLGVAIRPEVALDDIVRATHQSLDVSVRLAGPFIVAGILVNFAFGVVNKIAPQIPVIFISAPFVVAASLWLFIRLGGVLVGDAAGTIVMLSGRG